MSTDTGDLTVAQILRIAFSIWYLKKIRWYCPPFIFFEAFANIMS